MSWPQHVEPSVEYQFQQRPRSTRVSFREERGGKAAHRQQRQGVGLPQQPPSRVEYGFLQHSRALELR